jgi:hypothetical protein
MARNCLLNVCRWSIFSEIKRSGRESGQSPPFSAKFTNAWSHTSNPLQTFIVSTRITLPLPLPFTLYSSYDCWSSAPSPQNHRNYSRSSCNVPDLCSWDLSLNLNWVITYVVYWGWIIDTVSCLDRLCVIILLLRVFFSAKWAPLISKFCSLAAEQHRTSCFVMVRRTFWFRVGPKRF